MTAFVALLRVVVDGDAVWIDYATSVGSSKITPAALDRAVGSLVTARNWNIVRQIAAMLVDVNGAEVAAVKVMR